MSPNQGGIETFMMNVFLKLEGRGFHFTFLNIYKQGIACSKFILDHGGTIKTVLIPNNIEGHLIRKHKMMLFFRRCHVNYDIVHVNAMSINAIFWLEIANKFSIPKLIIQSHVSNRIYPSQLKKIFSLLLAIKSRYYLKHHSDIIELAVSSNAGKSMFHNNKFRVIANGINTNKFRFDMRKRIYFKEKLNIPMKYKVLITIARLSYQKNYLKIIRVFYEIHKIYPFTKLVVIGSGPEKSIIFHLVNKLGITNSVVFLGIVHNVYDILNVADLMLMPSRYEGFPFSLIECQSDGVPALVSTAVPLKSNITGKLCYLSVNDSNRMWAEKAFDMLKNSPNPYERIKMNEIVKKSDFNINKLSVNISNVYNMD